MTYPTTEVPVPNAYGSSESNGFDNHRGASDDTSKADQAKAAASTAADEGKHVAGVAQEEVSRVAGEATAQVKSLVGETRTQVSEQVTDQTRQQRDKLVSTLGTLGDDLDQMAANSQGGGLAVDLTREVAEHARTLTSYLDGREPGELMEDVRDFARRRPGLFLVGALAAGVVAGRVVRGVKDADTPPSVATTSPAPAAPVSDIPGYSTGPAFAAPPAPPMGITPPPPAPATTAMPTTPPPTTPPPAYEPFADRPGTTS